MYSKRAKIIVIPLFFLWAVSFAQNRIEVIVLDNERKILSDATVLTFQESDSTAKFTALSDSSGRVWIDYKKYDTTRPIILEVTHVNFEKYIQKLLPGELIAVVNMVPVSSVLQEVKVSSRKPTLERSEGKFVFNVSNTPLVNGNSVLYVLKRTPLVDVDQQNNIRLISSGATIYINDRPSQLTGAQLIEYLNNMPADNIVRLEIYPVAPAKFEGSGGVINLILKKVETDGLKGTITLSDQLAYYNSYSGGIWLNYHHNRYTQTFNLNAGRNNLKNIERVKNELINAKEYLEYNIDSRTEVNYWNVSTTIDYQLTSKSTIGAFVQSQGNKNEIDKWSEETKYSQSILENKHLNLIPSKGNSFLLTGSLYYKFRNDKKKQSLNFNLDYLMRDHPNENLFYNFEQSTNSLNYGNRITTSEDLENIAGQLDYKKFIFKSINWEAGFRLRSANTQSPYEYFNLVDNNWILNMSQTNYFAYKEKISSAYTTFNRRIGKWDAKIGGRLEYTDTHFGLRSEKKTSQSYSNFIPVINLGYASQQGNFLSLDIGNYPIRPSYSSLNPFLYNLGNNFFQTGNPTLKISPSLISSLTYVIKQRYILGLTYLHITQSVLFTNIARGDSIISIPFNNQGKDQVLLLNSIVESPSFIKNAIKIRVTQKLGFNKSRNLAPQLDMQAKAWSYNLKLDANMNLEKRGLQAFVQLQYLPTSNFGYLVWDPIFTLYGGITKNFPKHQLKINLELNNVTRFGLTSINRNSLVYSTTQSYDGSQGIRLSIIKSFGNTKAKGVEEKTLDNSRLGKDSKTKR